MESNHPLLFTKGRVFEARYRPAMLSSGELFIYVRRSRGHDHIDLLVPTFSFCPKVLLS